MEDVSFRNYAGKIGAVLFIFSNFMFGLLFQNCQNPSFDLQNFEETPSPPSIASLVERREVDVPRTDGGNGGYDGKPFVRPGDCDGVPHSAVSLIKVQKGPRAFMVREFCQNLSSPKEIPSVEMNFSESTRFIYRGSEYIELNTYLASLVWRYEAPGSFSWQKPGLGNQVEVECWGGGGAAGGAAGAGTFGDGGGGGGYSKGVIARLSLPDRVNVNVGAGGLGNGEGSTDGENSNFGILVVAEGGKKSVGIRPRICMGVGIRGGEGGIGTTESGQTSNGPNGGKAGGLEGGLGGLGGGQYPQNGIAPGGGGGAPSGIGGGGVCGNGYGYPGNGASGACRIRIQ